MLTLIPRQCFVPSKSNETRNEKGVKLGEGKEGEQNEKRRREKSRK